MEQKKIKRFTYYFTAKNSGLILFIQNLKKDNNNLEFHSFQIESNYFLIIDAPVDFNSKNIFNIICKTEGFHEVDNVFPNPDEALERIYELDQKDLFSPCEGQLKETVLPFKRFVWTLLLEPSLIEEYKRVHSIGMAWPEITANMKSIGVKDMEIYLHQNRAILIMDTKPDFNLDEIGPKWQSLPREEEWQKYVAKFQKTDPNSSIQEKWEDMLSI